jgi:hypothetical protein
MFIVVGSAIVLAIFLFVGWAVSAEMFQQRAWRKRVATGDVDIIGALIEEAMTYWRRGRIPRGMPGNRWAAIQGAELVAVEPNAATFSASVVPEYRSEGGGRVKVTSDIEEGEALAARLLELLMYDVPNLRLSLVRVDIFATVSIAEGQGQQPIISVSADRVTADSLDWDALDAHEILSRFETIWAEERDGAIIPITLPPIEGVRPRPAEEAARDAALS